MTAKTSISLTDAQNEYARSLVEAGKFPSLSAVLQQGLEMLRHSNQERDLEVDALRTLLDQRRSGKFMDLDEADADTRRMLKAKKKARASL